jgi:hypothetical protein
MDLSIINAHINIVDVEYYSFNIKMPKNKKNQVETENRKKIYDLYEENEYLSIKQNQSRARSITVGTAFGGVVEINVRSDAGSVYAQMQPTEAIELIEQLAAGVGVEIAIRPKVNFASWRGWEEVIKQRIGWDKIAWKGAAAWQLDGDTLEENTQKKLPPTKEKKLLAKEKEEQLSLPKEKNTRRKSKEKIDE